MPRLSRIKILSTVIKRLNTYKLKRKYKLKNITNNLICILNNMNYDIKPKIYKILSKEDFLDEAKNIIRFKQFI